MIEYFEKQFSHLFKIDKNNPQLIVIGGIPGAGKSTLVDKFEKAGYVVICPDRLRVVEAQKISGNENKFESELQDILQDMSKMAFNNAHDMILQHIVKGDSVIFDATNTTIKARRRIIQWAKEVKVEPIAIYLECPLDIAQERNIKRSSTVLNINSKGDKVYGRYVPGHVIKQKWEKQILPTKREGFKEIYIIHVGLKKNECDNALDVFEKLKNSNDLIKDLEENSLVDKLLPSLKKCWDINQENNNHIFPLHIHMIKSAEYLQKESLELFIAGLLHDVGKLLTKTRHAKIKIETNQFKIGEKVDVKDIHDNDKFIIVHKTDSNGERFELLTKNHIDINENYNYYDHHLVGSIIARRNLISLGINEEFSNKVYEYILHHMDLPYDVASEKTLKKIINNIGCENVKPIIKLREADKHSSGNSIKYLEEIHKHNIDLINEILNENKID